ncbi:hypothetical protein EN814_16310 [Mesorhizobium sp. M2D.F.Ca.ET.171.01.1.1]|uniref:hypothetical protein n=1 Tax=unclassified Mesorhizobium TaxID=325217 RepID=UPI001093040C|nr:MULTISPECIES: hypothetical protein [unclassified Mesorhizobium]TGS95265.1 hypothetical protein EN821_16325 [Mesorhizobium sp. M2D.F.Ca.ET.178.01.1.1]TGT10804.1 hypothetical protein EN814_16310 [Mesorhizobium sp. M2D.F.Ca.ET.171.01.1.1]
MPKKYCITYDIADSRPDPHGKLLELADEHGWSSYIWGETSGKWYHLPNTTLVGEFSTQADAKGAFDALVAAVSLEINRPVKVTRFFLSRYTESLFNSDIRVAPSKS